MVASFTRAAATELAGRDLPVSPANLGTLHSLCYHALHNPPIAQTAPYIKQWNEEHPSLQLSAVGGDVDDLMSDQTGERQGDAIMQEYMRLRSLRVTDYPTAALREFDYLWSLFKQVTGTIDFTDMIELALRGASAAPGNPQIGFFDEVQDFSALELALVRMWGSQMERVLLAGDDDQSIYWFKGATPEAFLDPPVPEEHNHVLRQSYRVPRAVQRVATDWIAQVARRHPKEYSPRDAEGTVERITGGYNNPDVILVEVEKALAAGKTMMILASCAYMLRWVITALRAAGVPFHNPYRLRQGAWNPLARHGRGSKRLSSSDRLFAFLRPSETGELWTGRELAQWIAVIGAPGVMPRGAKERASLLAESDCPLTLDEIHELFLPEHLPAIYRADRAWFEAHLLATKADVMKFPLAIAAKRGKATLRETPRVIVGTIHSVKGGEADEVILFPDLSAAAEEQWRHQGDGRDAIIRTFYVGMTRARERLVIGASASNCAVNL